MLENLSGDAGSVGLRGSNERGTQKSKLGEIYNQLDLGVAREMEASREAIGIC